MNINQQFEEDAIISRFHVELKSMGILLGTVSAACIFIAMYYNMIKNNLMRATEWMTIGFLLLWVAFLIYPI